MKNYIEMRPHHLLCLPGYKGNGYDKKHANSWDRVSASLREYPDMRIKIVSGKDTLCTSCPNDGSNGSTCNAKRLNILDDKVKMLLELKDNVVYRFNDLMDKVKSLMTPNKHKELCGDCLWWNKGLCQDTFEKRPAPYVANQPDIAEDDEYIYAYQI